MKKFRLILAFVIMFVSVTGTAIAQSEQAIILPATAATLKGPSVRMNQTTQVAAWWKGPEDRATWTFKVDKSANVELLLVYGVPNDLANQPFVVELEGKPIVQGKLPGTGGYATFQRQSIGKIKLSAGEHRLTFRPAGKVRGDDLIDLQSVILAPPGADLSKLPKLVTGQKPTASVDMLKHVRVPDGFVIEQVAGPPLVDRPISVDFDERGRLYVTEASGTNDNVHKQLADKPHRVLRLEDVDGDGVFDKRTIFADRMMLPEGAMWHDGSLYVTAPPHIWKLTDVNEDGIADKREVWFDGKTLGGCANDLHGPFLGPDGWFYWCKGEFEEQTYQRVGQPPLVTRAAHIFRRHPKGGPVEIVMTGGMNNPVDVAFMPGGERILSSTFVKHPAGGKRDGLIHAVYGGVYPKKNGVVNGFPRTGELMPVLTHMGAAAPCGLIRLETDQLGNGFKDSLLLCQFNTHKVSRHVLAPRGATFITQDEDFVTCDHIDFHPTDVLEDADGSVLVVDTGGWYMLCCPTSRTHKPEVLGAIYRVRRTGNHKMVDPRGTSIQWPQLNASQLARWLGDPRPAVDRSALERLVLLGKEAVPSLSQIVKSGSSTKARQQAVWALTRIDDPTARGAVRTALSDSDEQVRQAAIHSAALWRDSLAIDELVALLDGESLHNRRAAAEAIGRIGNKRGIDRILAAAADYRGRVLDHSLVYAMIEIDDVSMIRKGLAADDPQTRRAAMLALDNLADGNLQPDSIVELLDSDNPLMSDAAWWITQRHPEWATAMVTFFRKQILDANLATEALASLAQHLARFSESAEIQQIMADGLANADVSTPTKLAIMDAMATSHLKKVPQAWRTQLASVLTVDNPEMVAPAVVAIHAHLPSSMAGELKRVAINDRMPIETRLRALASSSGGENLNDRLMQLVCSQLSASRPVRNRSLAIDVILMAKLSDRQLVLLASKFKDTASMDLARLLTKFEKSTSEEVGSKFVIGLSESPAALALKLADVRRVLSRYPSTIDKQAGPLLKQLEVASAQKAAKFNKVLKLLDQGDVRRGHDIFYGTKAACSACHAIGYQGGNIGPDLTNIGRIRDDRSLLESTLYPSATFVQSYESTNILTLDGQIHNGVIREETTEEIVLSLDAEKSIRIRRDEVDEQKASSVSIMPTGLEQQLTPQQLADLIVFLKNAK